MKNTFDVINNSLGACSNTFENLYEKELAFQQYELAHLKTSLELRQELFKLERARIDLQLVQELRKYKAEETAEKSAEAEDKATTNARSGSLSAKRHESTNEDTSDIAKAKTSVSQITKLMADALNKLKKDIALSGAANKAPKAKSVSTKVDVETDAETTDVDVKPILNAPKALRGVDIDTFTNYCKDPTVTYEDVAKQYGCGKTSVFRYAVNNGLSWESNRGHKGALDDVLGTFSVNSALGLFNPIHLLKSNGKIKLTIHAKIAGRPDLDIKSEGAFTSASDFKLAVNRIKENAGGNASIRIDLIH